MKFDYEAFVKDLETRGAIPLIVLFGIPDSSGVNIDWLSTYAYDNADKQLQSDTNESVERVSRQING